MECGQTWIDHDYPFSGTIHDLVNMSLSMKELDINGTVVRWMDYDSATEIWHMQMCSNIW